MPLDDSVPLDGTTLLVTEVCARNPASVVFRGYVGLESVIVKMAETEYIKYLRHEYSIYGTLSPLQGIIIPKCFGLFSLSPTCYIMILEDCGKPVSELSHLVDDQRCAPRLDFYINLTVRSDLGGPFSLIFARFIDDVFNIMI